MFETFEFQYLNKLIEGEVRDFTSPEAFHCLKVQRLGSNCIKPSAQVGRKFPMPIETLAGNFSIKPCEVSNGSVPIVRTLLLTASLLIQRPELVQGLFQGLRMLNLLTGVKCQIDFHTKVCAYTFTCSGQHFFAGVIGNDIEPKRSNGISTNLDIADVSFPIAMVMEREVNFLILIELLRTWIPHSKRDANTSLLKFVGIRKLRRAIFLAFLELRRSYAPAVLSLFEIIKKPFPSKVKADNHSIKRVARDPRPVFLGALEQLCQMRLQTKTTGILAIDAIVPLLEFEEVVMDIRKIVKQVAQTFVFRMSAYLIFVRSQGVTSYQSLTPTQWVGRHVTLRLRCVCLPTGM